MIGQEMVPRAIALLMFGRRTRRVLPSPSVPVRKRFAHQARATRQVRFDYSPSNGAELGDGIVSRAIQWQRQHPMRSLFAMQPVTHFHDVSGVLGSGDRFQLDHAASALQDLQHACIAGGAVIRLSTTALMDPLLPVYVRSLLERRGVHLRGVRVNLADTPRECD